MLGEKIAPTVLLRDRRGYPERTVTPPGWMWVLSFALAGCDWAIKECETEEFRERVREWYRARDEYCFMTLDLLV